MTHVLGSTWLEITRTAAGRTAVTCSGCGAANVFEDKEEPRLEHRSLDCPVFCACVSVQKAFIEMSGSRWLT